MNAFKEMISGLAEEFVSAILEAVRGASLDDLSSVGGSSTKTHAAGGYRPPVAKKSGGGKGGKRVRRSEEAIQEVAEQIAVFVKKHKDGVGAETIREELGIDRKDLSRPMTEALGQKLISKRGEKRGTLYFAGGKKSGGGKKAAKKAPKKSAKKKAVKKSAKKAKSATNGVAATTTPTT